MTDSFPQLLRIYETWELYSLLILYLLLLTTGYLSMDKINWKCSGIKSTNEKEAESPCAANSESVNALRLGHIITTTTTTTKSPLPGLLQHLCEQNQCFQKPHTIYFHMTHP